MAKQRLTEDDVATTAEVMGVPPELALAIWQQESSSGRNAGVSPKGAVGGFQVMPATFKRYYPNGDINDPVDNMLAGLRVLKDGLDRYGGNMEKASQFYYHGRALAPGEEGPTSGPGTPTVLGYGKNVLAKIDQIAQRRGGRAAPEEKEEQPEPTQLASNNMFGMPEEGEEPETEQTAATEDEGEEQGNVNFDIAGLTRGLVPYNGSFGGAQDMAMNNMGSQSYDFDRYIRQMVDEELKA